MFRKLFSILTMSAVLFVSSGLTFGQSKNNWSAVEDLADQEVAVKTKSGMKYGIVRSVDVDGLVLQLAGKKRMSQNEMTISKNDIKKIWRAFLFANERNTGKGALIGGGTGLGAGIIYARSDAAKGDGQASIAIPYLAVVGAGIGGVIGYFSKKKHKKQELVYKR